MLRWTPIILQPLLAFTRIVVLLVHCFVYPLASYPTTVSLGGASFYPYPLTFLVGIECLLAFALVVIIPIKTFHASLTRRSAWVIEFWWPLCSKCIPLGLSARIRKLISLFLSGKREICSRWYWHGMKRHKSSRSYIIFSLFVSAVNLCICFQETEIERITFVSGCTG